MYGQNNVSEISATNNILNFEVLTRKSIFASITRLSNSCKTVICNIQSYLVIFKRHTNNFALPYLLTIPMLLTYIEINI